MPHRSAGPARSPSISGPILLVGLLLGALDTLQQHAGNALREVDASFGWTVLNNFVPWLLLLPFLPLVAKLAERWPLEAGRWVGHLARHLGATLILVLIHQGLVALVLISFAAPGTYLGMLWTKLVTFRFPVDALMYWGVVAAVHATGATRRAREREQAAARLEASLAEARLTALREQLHPHFLFNSLNAVSTLALRGDREQVTRALTTLSELLRLTLESQRAQEVPLAEELAFLDRYLELQQLRFGDRLTVRREIDDAVLDGAVPVMLTQPLVENAVRHGIAREPGPGLLEIRARRVGESLVVEVCDNGPGFGRGGLRPDGIGLANTRARLAGLYGGDDRLQCGDRPGGGAWVRVTLPYRALPVPTPLPEPAA